MGKQRMLFVFLLLKISMMYFLQAQSSNFVEIRGLFLAFRTNSKSVITKNITALRRSQRPQFWTVTRMNTHKLPHKATRMAIPCNARRKRYSTQNSENTHWKEIGVVISCWVTHELNNQLNRHYGVRPCNKSCTCARAVWLHKRF